MAKELNQIKSLLEHKYIRERKKGIRKAAEVLEKGQHREELCTLLFEISQKDLIISVRDLAKEMLKEHNCLPPDPPQYTEGAEHMVGGVCRHCGHPNYYDKQVECQEVEGVRRVKGKVLSKLAVTCEECGKDFKLEDVDCEGYR